MQPPKRSEPVEVPAPRDSGDRAVTGFARIEVHGDLELPVDASTHDLENLRRKRRR